jgi:hypothetical protein
MDVRFTLVFSQPLIPQAQLGPDRTIGGADRVGRQPLRLTSRNNYRAER